MRATRAIPHVYLGVVTCSHGPLITYNLLMSDALHEE